VSGTAPSAAGAPSATNSAATAPSASAPTACGPVTLPLEVTKAFRKSRSKAYSKSEPHHFAMDAVGAPGSDVTLRAKLTYGSAGKDLEEELVAFFVRQAGACDFTELGRAETDDDGWARFTVKGTKLPTGAHDLAAAVVGDGTFAMAKLFVAAPGTKTVVFDVDATLTTSDREVVEEVLKGKVPEMRTDAPAVVQAYAKAGFFLAFVTGRPYLLLRPTKEWLRDRGFPEGYLRVTDRSSESIPDADGVQRFKEAALLELKSAGLTLDQAYGNAKTDICAYLHVGLDPKRTFILGPHGGQPCGASSPTVGLASYTEQLPKLPALTGP
jgi:phosphatidate phosphatase PAH1